MTPRRIVAATAAALLGLAALTACGGSSDDTSSGSSSSSSASASSAAPSSSAASSAAPSSSSSAPKPKTAKIMIKDYKYSGDTSVAPGTKITVTNADSEAHTVTADTGSAFDVSIPPGKTATLTAPSKAGSYAYHCTYHSDMHGKLTVS